MGRIRGHPNPRGRQPRAKKSDRRGDLLTKDPKIQDWYNERALQSRLSADHYIRHLSRAAERLALTPEEIVGMARSKPDRLRAQMTRTAAGLKSEGLLDSYVAKWFEAIKSYLRFRRVNADVFPHLSAAKGESLGNEIVPTQEQLGRVLERLSPRGRVIALLMAHAGLRPGAIGAYQGEGGLRLRDLRDLKLGPTLTFAEVPFEIRVPAAISKTRQAYTTFGTSQLATSLLAYLEDRQKDGEELSPDSPVVVARIARGAAARSLKDAKFHRGFLTTKAVVEELHDALTATVPEGGRWRPYAMRAYCSTRLLAAEGAGKITSPLRESILGHNLGVAGRYNLAKTWGPETLKDARASYRASAPYLETNASAGSHDDAVAKALRLLALARGVPPEKLEGLDLSGKSEEEIVAFMRKVGIGATAPLPQREEAVPVEEVPARLAAGWTTVTRLNDSMAVLRAPVALPDSVVRDR